MHFLSKALVLLLALSSTTASLTPEECVELNKNLSAEELHTILGKWTLILAYGNTDDARALLKTAGSSQTEFSFSNNNQTVTFQQSSMRHDTCTRYTTNYTVSGYTIQLSRGTASSTAYFLQSCTDCLVMHHTLVLAPGKKAGFLLIYGKTGKLPESELEKARKQALCLDFEHPPHMFYNEGAEFCPDETETSEFKCNPGHDKVIEHSAAAPPTEHCSQLSKPLTVDELDKILGKWIFIQGLANHKTATLVKTITLETSANNDTLLMVQELQYEENDICIPVPMNFTLSGGTIQLEREDKAEKAYFLQSCADCLVMHHTFIPGCGKKNEILNIYGRTGNLTESELDETRKQALCLGFEPLLPVYSEPGSCPTPQNQPSQVKEQ